MQTLHQLRTALKTKRHRQLVILSGSSAWHQQQLSQLFKMDEVVLHVISQKDSGLKQAGVSPATQTVIETKHLKHMLGQEVDGAIFSAEAGISADSLGIVSGMIKSGGLLIILTPDREVWGLLNNPEDDRFLSTPFTQHNAHKTFTHHLIHTWQSSNVTWLHEFASELNQIPSLETVDKRPLPLPTADQMFAIKGIHKVAFGHRKRPLVLNADRGRGKTSALGLAAINCLKEGKKRVVITASRPDQVKAAFRIALDTLKSLMEWESGALKVITSKPTLLEFKCQGVLKQFEYMAPDQLIIKPSMTDLLMVDEAAHLPNTMLLELLNRHHRIVFSTSLHGYEGSGRGFELRFKKHLDQKTPDWRLCKLRIPVRWNDNDPLEAAISDALLLSAKPPELCSQITKKPKKERVQYRSISAEELFKNQNQLKAVFGILVQAHYQTSPNDLQQLLNAPNIEIIIAEYSVEQEVPVVIGAALCVAEGRINAGKTRAHGHLVPQLLTKNYATPDFLMLSTLRIMRIAVSPELQRNKIGRGLIQFVEQLGQQKRVDYISSSFGSNDDLLSFWFQEQYRPLHVGVRRDKSSGSHNVIVAKPLTAMARQAISMVQNCFQEQFPHLLFESLPHMSAEQILQIMQTFRFKTMNYSLERTLQAYYEGARPYESISNQLWEWSLQYATKILQASPKQKEIWCDKILKTRSWESVAHRHHLAGRKAVETELRTMIENWVAESPKTSASIAPKRYS